MLYSRVSTPVKRKNRDLGGGGRGDYGGGQINAYPPPAAGANPAAGAVMMSLAEELLTKKGLSLKDLQVMTATCLVLVQVWFLFLMSACTVLQHRCISKNNRHAHIYEHCHKCASCCRLHTSTPAASKSVQAMSTSSKCDHSFDLQEDQEEYADTGEKQAIPRSKRPVTKHWNWVGLAICLYYVAAALYYFIIRGAYTLNMGYLG